MLWGQQGAFVDRKLLPTVDFLKSLTQAQKEQNADAIQ
jgi:hypothetical protein